MKYRFLLVTSFYQSYLGEFYKQRPNLALRPYADQLNEIFSDAFGVANFIPLNLSRLGHETHAIIANAMPAQRAWAREHGIQGEDADITLHQIKSLKPDVVFFQDSFSFSKQWLDQLRSEVPSIRLILGWCCVPYSLTDLDRFKAFDFMLTCSPTFQQRLCADGLKTYQIYHAFESTLLARIRNSVTSPSADVVFTGSIFLGAGYHNNRMNMLGHIIKSGIDLRVYSDLRMPPLWEVAFKQVAYGAAKGLRKCGLSRINKNFSVLRKADAWPAMPRSPKVARGLRRALSPGLFGMDMYRALASCKIGLNFHIDSAGNHAANVRLFETTGVGACLVTDWKDNLPELFEPDKEIVTYRSSEECLDKLQWLLRNDDAREKIAKAGQARCLRDHTFAQRAIALDRIVQSEISL